MRIQSHTKIIGLSLLGLFLFSALAHADSTEDYRREAQEDVYARSNDAQSPQDRVKARNAAAAASQDSSVLKDASDYTAATYESLRDSFAGLYTDASSTLGGWQSTLGDKWNDFVDSFSDKKDDAASKVDQAQEKARDSFHDTISDFEHYQKVFEKTGQKYSDQARSTLNGLLKDVQTTYGNWKNAAKDTYDEWTGQVKQSATDKAKDAAKNAANDAVKDVKSKARQSYDAAKDKYFEAKARLDAELHAQGGLTKEEYVSALKTQRNVLNGKNVLPSTAAILEGASATLKGASDTLKGASDTIYNSASQAANYSSATYESLKDKLAALYGDASTTVSAWQTTLGDKWDDFAGSLSLKSEDHEQSPAYGSFHNTINDFEYYQKVFVDETANDTYTQEAKDRINALIGDLGDSYNNLKLAAKRRYDEWTGAAPADDKSHALVAYKEAQSKYYQSKERLQHEFDFVTGKIDNATYQAKAASQGKNILGRAADAVNDVIENVKGHFASGTEETLKRYEDAANTAAQKRDEIKDAVSGKIADAKQSATEAINRTQEDYEELKKQIKAGAGEL